MTNISVKGLLGARIVDHEEEVCGRLEKVLFMADTGRVSAFLFLGESMMFAAEEVSEIAGGKIVVKTSEASKDFIEDEESLRMTAFIGLTCRQVGGGVVGEIADAEFEPAAMILRNLIVARKHGEILVARDRIVKVEANNVYIKRPEKKVRVLKESPQTALA